MAQNESKRITIYINGKEIENTIKSIKNEATKLRNEITNKLTPGTAEYNRKVQEFRKLDGVIDNHNQKLRGTAGIWGSIKTEVKQFGAMAIAYLGAGQVISGIDNLIGRTAKLEDTYADVAKTTGLTIEQVKELNKEFSKIDTRSSRDELNSLAEIAGKLGISSQAEIVKFVESADKINVALSKDLGGDIEGTVKSLGKLSELFGGKFEFGIGEDLNKIGSAINSVGAASTASEQFLVNFSSRLGGIAPQAGLSLPAVLGIGSALDQLGQQAETSSTVFTQLLPKMFTDTKLFADIAGKGVKEFSDLLKKDSNEALLLFLDGLQKNQGGLEELSHNLDGIGIEGSKAIGVLGALSNNTELLRKEQNLANKAYEEGTSLTEEFSIKNSTLGAVLDKLSKKISSAFVSGELNDALKSMAYWVDQNFHKIINLGKAFLQIGGVILAYKAIIIGAQMSMQAYRVITLALSYAKALYTGNLLRANGAQMALNATTSKGNVVMKITEALTKLVAAGKALLTGNIVGARLAMQGFNKSIMANPLGLLAMALTAIVSIFILYKSRVEEATEAQQEFNAAVEEGNRLTASVKDLEARMSTVAKLSKAQLQALLDDIDAELAANENKEAALMAQQQKSHKQIQNTEKSHLEKLNTLKEDYANAKDGIEASIIEKQIEAIEYMIENEASMIVAHEQGISQSAVDNNQIQLESWRDMVAKKLKATTTFVGDNKDVEDEALKELEKSYEAYHAFLRKMNDDAYLNSLNDKARELELIRQKYQEQFDFVKEQFGENSAEYLEMLNLQNDELTEVELNHLQELNDLIKELKDEIWIEAIDDATTKASEEIELEREKELAKVAEYENAAELRKLIDEKYDLQQAQLKAKTDAAKALADKAKDEISKKDRIATLDATAQMLGQIGGMLNKGSKAWKGVKMAETLISTYTSAQKAYEAAQSLTSPMNLIMGVAGAAIATASGMQQLRAIRSTNIPEVQEQFFEGGYQNVKGPKDKKIYNAKNRFDMYGGMVDSPSIVLGGEKGPEYWVNNDMLKVPMVSNVVGAMESLRTKKINVVDFQNIVGSISANKQFVTGGYTNANIPSYNPKDVNRTDDAGMSEFVKLLTKLNENLENPKSSVALFSHDYFTKQEEILADIKNDAKG
jgi:TP901 family phage tail tape measure protein